VNEKKRLIMMKPEVEEESIDESFDFNEQRKRLKDKDHLHSQEI